MTASDSTTSGSSEMWQRIRIAMRKSGLNQSELASRCGVTRAAVSQWIHSDPARRTTPGRERVKKIALATGVSFERLNDDSAGVSCREDAPSAHREPPDNSSFNDGRREIVLRIGELICRLDCDVAVRIGLGDEHVALQEDGSARLPFLCRFEVTLTEVLPAS